MIGGRAMHALENDQCKNCLGFGHWAFQCPSPTGQDLPKIQKENSQESVANRMILPQEETFFCEEIFYVDERLYQNSTRDFSEKLILEDGVEDSVRDLREKLILSSKSLVTDPQWVKPDAVEDLAMDLVEQPLILGEESMQDIQEKLIFGNQRGFLGFSRILAPSKEDLKSGAKSPDRHIINSADGGNLGMPVLADLKNRTMQAFEIRAGSNTCFIIPEIHAIVDKRMHAEAEFISGEDSTPNLQAKLIFCQADPNTDQFVKRIFKEDKKILIDEEVIYQREWQPVVENHVGFSTFAGIDCVNEISQEIQGHWAASLVKLIPKVFSIDERTFYGSHEYWIWYMDMQNQNILVSKFLLQAGDPSLPYLVLGFELIEYTEGSEPRLNAGHTWPNFHLFTFGGAVFAVKPACAAQFDMLEAREDCKWALIWKCKGFMWSLDLRAVELLACLSWQTLNLRPSFGPLILDSNAQCPSWVVSCFENGLYCWTESEEQFRLDDHYGVLNELRISHCWEYSSFASFLSFTIQEVTVDTFIWDPG